MLILGAVRTPSPPPSGHLLRGGSSKEDEDYTFLNEGVIARSTSKKTQSHGWRMAGFAGSSPALGSHPFGPTCLFAKPYRLLSSDVGFLSTHRGLNYTDPFLSVSDSLFLFPRPQLSRGRRIAVACHKGQANGSAKILGSSSRVRNPLIIANRFPSISEERRRDGGRFPNTAIKLSHPRAEQASWLPFGLAIVNGHCVLGWLSLCTIVDVLRH